MMIVRNSFVAWPGQAGNLAAVLKDVSTLLPKSRVLTDTTGKYNRVIMEFEVATSAEYDACLHQYATDPEVRARMRGYTDLWVTSMREILSVV